ncbi:hypothetical protein D3C72_2578710 [compost metagenome]
MGISPQGLPCLQQRRPGDTAVCRDRMSQQVISIIDSDMKRLLNAESLIDLK